MTERRLTRRANLRIGWALLGRLVAYPHTAFTECMSAFNPERPVIIIPRHASYRTRNVPLTESLGWILYCGRLDSRQCLGFPKCEVRRYESLTNKARTRITLFNSQICSSSVSNFVFIILTVLDVFSRIRACNLQSRGSSSSSSESSSSSSSVSSPVSSSVPSSVSPSLSCLMMSREFRMVSSQGNVLMVSRQTGHWSSPFRLLPRPEKWRRQGSQNKCPHSTLKEDRC